MNEKINALLELLPTVTENPMFSQLTPECPQLLTYLTDNHELLSTIHDKLSSFCELRQEIRAKASLEKLRLDDLYQTPSRKEQIEQFSNAKNRELSNAKQSMMELNNELLEKEARLQRMADEIEAVRRGARAQEEQNKYLREFY
jgi:ubiquinone biosynthesis protein Coq4